MGLTFTKLFARLFSKKEMRILMVRHVSCPRDAPKLKVLSRAETVRRSEASISAPARLWPQHAAPGRKAAQCQRQSAVKALRLLRLPATGLSVLMRSHQRLGRHEPLVSMPPSSWHVNADQRGSFVCGATSLPGLAAVNFTQHRSDGSH